MDNVNYIVTFTTIASLHDEPKILYFRDEKNAISIYETLSGSDEVVDCYLNQVIRSAEKDKEQEIDT